MSAGGWGSVHRGSEGERGTLWMDGRQGNSIIVGVDSLNPPPVRTVNLVTANRAALKGFNWRDGKSRLHFYFNAMANEYQTASLSITPARPHPHPKLTRSSPTGAYPPHGRQIYPPDSWPTA